MRIIAEAGVNHGGKLEKAFQLVDIAREAGADIVKFQIFNADTCRGEYREILRPLQLTYAEHEKIRAHCQDVGIDYLASCFDISAVDFVLSLGLADVKVGSGELTNHALLEHIGEKDLNLILSTGMADMQEVKDAVDAFDRKRERLQGLSLLHCVSLYPAMPRHMNLNAIRSLRDEFCCPVGLSDHTLTNTPAIMAVAMGCSVIEKHFTLDPNEPGPDHAMSLSPEELKIFVSRIREAEVCLGNGIKEPAQGEMEMRKIARGRWCTG